MQQFKAPQAVVPHFTEEKQAVPSPRTFYVTSKAPFIKVMQIANKINTVLF